MEFVEKIKLEKGQNAEMVLSAKELYDIEKQVQVYIYDTSSRTYKHVKNEQTMKTSSSSVYQVSTYPVEFRVNAETDKVTVGHSSYYPMILYIFK